MNAAPTMAEMEHLAGALPRVRALQHAAKSGDVHAVRAEATQLLAEYSFELIRTYVGYALLWIGDAVEALPLLPADAHIDRGWALSVVGRFDDARRELLLAEEFDDQDPRLREAAFDVEGRANMAGRLAVGVGINAADPVDRERRNTAFEHLRRGDWDVGLKMYLETNHCRNGTRPLKRIGGDDCPPWSGEPVNHLLALMYGGTGDLLQFGRYIVQARRLCRRVTLVCEPDMQSLIRRVLSVDTVSFAEYSPVKQVADAYTIVDLLLADVLKVKYGEPMPIEPVAGSVPGLGDGMHVGLCWSASALGSSRSVRFAALSPLQFLPDVNFHSLQVGGAANDAGPWVKRHALRSYEDTTSLIAALDAVITVDTSVAHLAGNMGKPTHLLLCPHEDWRWGLGDTTPWYPSMRLYRGNLGKAVKDIAERVRAVANDPGLDERSTRRCK